MNLTRHYLAIVHDVAYYMVLDGGPREPLCSQLSTD